MLILRMVLGGLLVTIFAIVGDILRPKRFAGLFGSAPSIALATLALTIQDRGKIYASTEARSMVAGAVAFTVYCFCVSLALSRFKAKAIQVTILLVPLWFALSFGIWFVVLRNA